MIKITIEIDMISISTKFEFQTNGFNNTNNKFQSGTSYIFYLYVNRRNMIQVINL